MKVLVHTCHPYIVFSSSGRPSPSSFLRESVSFLLGLSFGWRGRKIQCDDRGKACWLRATESDISTAMAMRSSI